MSTVIAPPPQVLVPVFGSDAAFPVGRIFCVGRNYAAHAREMGHEPGSEPPFFFAKWADTVVPSGSTIPYPVATQDLHHEVELVVAIGTGGTDIAPERALDHVWGYGVGLDMTRRDIQGEAKKMARPWTMAKSFDQSAPMSALRPAAEIGHPAQGAILLTLNGENRQTGDLADQIWPVPQIIAHLSRLVEVRPGDLIMTGTPDGVGPVKPGDTLAAQIDGVGELTVTYR